MFIGNQANLFALHCSVIALSDRLIALLEPFMAPHILTPVRSRLYFLILNYALKENGVMPILETLHGNTKFRMN